METPSYYCGKTSKKHSHIHMWSNVDSETRNTMLNSALISIKFDAPSPKKHHPFASRDKLQLGFVVTNFEEIHSTFPLPWRSRMFGCFFFDGFNRGGFIWDFGIGEKSPGSGKDGFISRWCFLFGLAMNERKWWVASCQNWLGNHHASPNFEGVAKGPQINRLTKAHRIYR